MKTSAIILLFTLAMTASAAPQSANRQRGGQNGGGNNNVGNTGKGNNNVTGGNGGIKGGVNGGAAAGNSTAVNNGPNATNTTGTATNSTAPAQIGDPQTSLTLDPGVIAKGFANDGQDVPADGQVSSLTSTNNFINFCLTVPNLPLTDGKQITTGSCNPAPMGAIPSSDNMPSAKFTVPKNGDTLKENTAFTISMAISNMQTGAFVNAVENYFSAPQQLNAQGQIIGHSHVVVETLTAFDQTTPLDPQKFAFFKGLNAAAAGGILTADVSSGLPAGFYKLSSINTAANHQPVLVPIAQHGSLDDVVYFTITADGAPAQAAAGGAAAGNGTTTASAPATATGGAAANGGAAVKGGKAGAAAPAPAKGNAASNNSGKNPNGNGKGRRMLARMWL